MQGVKGTTGRTVCDFCGKEIKRCPARIKPHKHHYCNNECRWQAGHSEETKRKLSEGKRGKKNPMYGKQPSEETRHRKSEASRKVMARPGMRSRIAKTLQGRPNSEEQQRKQSGTNAPMYGKHHTDETKQKLSEASSGKRHHNYGKHLSEKTRRKIGNAQRGSKSHRYGKKASNEDRRKMSERRTQYLMNGGITYPGNAKPGYYKGIYMRSQSEIKVAQWLDRIGIAWQYEVRIPLGIHNYLPDFYLPEYGIFWEVKGYFREEARQKMARVRALYPESKFVIIDEAMLQFLGIEVRRQNNVRS